MTQDLDFESLLEEMQAVGLDVPRASIMLELENARNVLGWTYQRMLQREGKAFSWAKEYDEVADWLTCSHGKGLLLQGDCGRGKTYLARYVLPAILLNQFGLVARYYDATGLGRKIDEALRSPIVIVDDLGTETTHREYGNVREPFCELIDASEKDSKLIIVTTNSTNEQLLDRYRERAFDRLISTTRCVRFSGDSLRGA